MRSQEHLACVGRKVDAAAIPLERDVVAALSHEEAGLRGVVVNRSLAQSSMYLGDAADGAFAV